MIDHNSYCKCGHTKEYHSTITDLKRNTKHSWCEVCLRILDGMETHLHEFTLDNLRFLEQKASE